METRNPPTPAVPLEKFKSYYVVWKPEEKWETLAFRLRFKSYYVVWKQIFVVIIDAYEGGLNRTM